MNNITQDKLKELLHYDTETGHFTWIVSKGAVKAGKIAGNLTKDGYMRIKINGQEYKSHRLVWLYVHGKFPPDQIDHISGVKNDNRIVNLRCVNTSENAKNRKLNITNTSGYVGVTWNKLENKWMAYIYSNSLRIHLGYFEDKFEAAKARKSAENKLGFHRNHGRR